MNDASHPTDSKTTYLLGHSDHEIERLQTQAQLIDPVTRRIFIEAGIVPGMRVLDVGSGAGDVAFLAADLVGPGVVGVDRVAGAIDAARERAVDASFVEGLGAPSTRLEALSGGGTRAVNVLRLMADITATLLPEMERLGVANAPEVGIDDLFDRMQREVVAKESFLIGHLPIGAWSHAGN